VPTRVERAEAFLVGKKVTLSIVAEAADIVASDIDPVSDARGDAGYRRDMVRVVTRRHLEQLFGLSQE
jgi:carbon-monoxide dehydrogenase medium subunit